MTKQQLRKEYLEKRRSLTTSQVDSLSSHICERFLSDINLSGVKVIHTFLPIAKNNEPNTWLIIQSVQRSGSPIRFSVPRVTGHDGTMDHFYLEGNTNLEQNSWGISEPKTGQPTSIADIDIVLVPLLAFDLTGQRTGYGKGYYDRFLNQCRVETKRIGISFFPPVDRIDDANEFDAPLHYCITPGKTFTF
jgi:5-formyltetrahydrofolate cyclo-ligase